MCKITLSGNHLGTAMWLQGTFQVPNFSGKLHYLATIKVLKLLCDCKVPATTFYTFQVPNSGGNLHCFATSLVLLSFQKKILAWYLGGTTFHIVAMYPLPCYLNHQIQACSCNWRYSLTGEVFLVTALQAWLGPDYRTVYHYFYVKQLTTIEPYEGKHEMRGFNEPRFVSVPWAI